MSLHVPPAAPLTDEDLQRALIRLDAAMKIYELKLKPTVIRRIWNGISQHFSKRYGEWFTAIVLTRFGYALCVSPDLFMTAQNFSVMARLAEEETWGAACIACGAIHLCALFVNGTFPAFHWSPHIRATTSLVACFVWFQISLALYQSGVGGTGLQTYSTILALEFYNFLRAMRDTGTVDGRRASNGG